MSFCSVEVLNLFSTVGFHVHHAPLDSRVPSGHRGLGRNSLLDHRDTFSRLFALMLFFGCSMPVWVAFPASLACCNFVLPPPGCIPFWSLFHRKWDPTCWFLSNVFGTPT